MPTMYQDLHLANIIIRSDFFFSFFFSPHASFWLHVFFFLPESTPAVTHNLLHLALSATKQKGKQQITFCWHLLQLKWQQHMQTQNWILVGVFPKDQNTQFPFFCLI